MYPLRGGQGPVPDHVKYACVRVLPKSNIWPFMPAALKRYANFILVFTPSPFGLA